jgi:hypothetical protein
MRNRLLAAALACIALPAAADTAVTVYSSARPGAIDPAMVAAGGDEGPLPGFAIVREERSFTLAADRNRVRVSDVPALIDATTVAFASLTDPGGTRVVEQSFEFDLTSPAKLLSRYLDREITVEQALGDAVQAFSGTLLGTRDGITLLQPDGAVRILQHHAGIRLPSLPGGLISKPTLVWDIDAAKAGEHRARLAYQTAGMTWWADYNAILSEPAPGACSLDLGAWVTLVNRSGASYPQARLKLVAGDVQRVQPAPPQVAMMARAAVERADGFAEKAFFEYHLYTLGRTTSLPDNSTKQIELFPRAPEVGCEKVLVYQGQAPQPVFGAPFTERSPGIAANRKVDVHLRLRNSKAGGLGMPLPAGRLRVSRLDPADGAIEFIGEDVIGHTPRDETVQVRLGSAFDVVGERRQLDFRIDLQAKWMEEDIEVKVRNRKAQAARVIVKELAYRWSAYQVLRKSHEFTREDARTMHFPVEVASGAEAIVRYTIRYTW